jgi:hypothetical protein
MGIGSTLAVELAEERYLEEKTNWIQDKLGDNEADENTPGWLELEEEFAKNTSDEAEYLDAKYEEEMRRKDDIRDVVDELKVPALVHFTQLSNLENILKEGLYSRSKVGEDVNINDELRLDGREDTISTSIAFPNSRMFYKYRQEKGGLWCVVAISKRVLWELDCLFCKHNAADANISSQPDSVLSEPKALKSMYDEHNHLDSREDQKLRKYDPTDVQAEVLVKKHIPSKYIVGVVFPDKPSKDKHAHLTSKRKVIQHSHNKGYFAARSYVRR